MTKEQLLLENRELRLQIDAMSDTIEGMRLRIDELLKSPEIYGVGQTLAYARGRESAINDLAKALKGML
jgi:hypothetical protein